MNDTGTIGQRDIAVCYDIPTTLFGLPRKGIERLVVHANEFLSLDSLGNLGLIAQHLSTKRLCQNVSHTILDSVDVIFHCVDNQRNVQRQYDEWKAAKEAGSRK